MSKNKEENEKNKNSHVVYIHINKINNKKYIGITCQVPEKRWGNNGSRYKDSPYFYNAIKKHGWDNFEHIILYKKLCCEDAKKIEKQLIAEHKTMNDKYGYNLTVGGDGSFGFKHSVETRKKLSTIKKGTKASEETKKKISQKMKGREFADKTKQKMSKSKTGYKNPSAKPVVQLNSNYELIEEFECAIYVEKKLGINAKSVSKVCTGRMKSAGGYIFMFKNDFEDKKDELKGRFVETRSYRRKVNQLTLGGEYIRTFDSISEAAKTLNIDVSVIFNVCKGIQKTSGGFKWEYAS